MPTLTMGPTLGDLLKYEQESIYTRETVTLLTGTNYALGSVLGRITASGKYTLSPDTGADGSQVARAVLLFPVDASAGDQTGVVLRRGGSVSVDRLVYAASVNDAAKRTAKQLQLADAGIAINVTE